MKTMKTMAFILTLSILIPTFTPVYASSVEDIRTQIEENETIIEEMKEKKEYIGASIEDINAEMLKLSEDMRNLFVEINEEKEDISLLDEEIRVEEGEVQKIDDIIRKTEDDIIYLSKDIEEDETNLMELEKKMDKRIRTEYMNSSTQKVVFVILESSSLSEFFERLHFLEILVKKDQMMMENIEKEVRELQVKKNLLKDTRRKLMDEKYIAEDRKSALLDTRYRRMSREEELMEKLARAQVLEDEKRAAMKKLSLEEEMLVQNVGDIMTENALLQSELYNLISLSEYANDTPSLQGFIRPVPGRLTSPFGYRIHPIWNDRRFHSGIDLASPMGTPILAAKDGTVITSTYLRSYGNTVIIDHGGGESSLYAHMDSLGIKVGENVSRGETLGTVGSTGDSTGPHLHFEIRVGGNPVNPNNYIN